MLARVQAIILSHEEESTCWRWESSKAGQVCPDDFMKPFWPPDFLNERKYLSCFSLGGLAFSVTLWVNLMLTDILSISCRPPEFESRMLSLVAEGLQASYSDSLNLCLFSYKIRITMPSGWSYSDILETNEIWKDPKTVWSHSQKSINCLINKERKTWLHGSLVIYCIKLSLVQMVPNNLILVPHSFSHIPLDVCNRHHASCWLLSLSLWECCSFLQALPIFPSFMQWFPSSLKTQPKI